MGIFPLTQDQNSTCYLNKGHQRRSSGTSWVRCQSVTDFIQHLKISAGSPTDRTRSNTRPDLLKASTGTGQRSWTRAQWMMGERSKRQTWMDPSNILYVYCVWVFFSISRHSQHTPWKKTVICSVSNQSSACVCVQRPAAGHQLLRPNCVYTQTFASVCGVVAFATDTFMPSCLCMYVSPCPFSRRRPFNSLLMKSHGKHGGEGGECVCVYVLVCAFPLFFSPVTFWAVALIWAQASN